MWGEKTAQPQQEVNPLIAELQSLYTEDELKGIIGLKKDAAPVELVEIAAKTTGLEKEGNTGFLIASDCAGFSPHIGEVLVYFLTGFPVTVEILTPCSFRYASFILNFFILLLCLWGLLHPHF